MFFVTSVSAVLAGAAERLGDPHRVAAEELVVLRRAQVARHAQLQDEIVDDFLRAALVERALFQVALKVDVEEGGDAAEAHRRAVLLLDRREVGEVDPLHGLARVFRRAGDVVAVHFRHLLHVVQRGDLVRDLLHEADRVGVDRLFAELRLVRLLLQDQAVHAVQRDAAVVADDAAAAVGVRQARDDARVARGAHVVGIGGENAVVVRLVVFEFVFDRVGNLIAVGLAGRAHHAHAAERGCRRASAARPSAGRR